MTSLSDLEIVVGKLVAGLLNILIILGASVGLLSICALLGGISFGQVANLFAVTAASGVAGGAMGLLIALWRDRTFQSISLTILMVVFSVAGVELFAVAFPTVEFLGVPVKEILSPIRAMLAVLYPRSDQSTGVVQASSLVYIGIRLSFAALIVAFGTWKLRKWNPGRNEPREQADETETEVIESLVEVEEELAEVPVAVGARDVAAGGSPGGGIAERSRVRDGGWAGRSRRSPVRRFHRPHDRTSRAQADSSPRRGRAQGRTAGPGPIRSSGASS